MKFLGIAFLLFHFSTQPSPVYPFVVPGSAFVGNLSNCRSRRNDNGVLKAPLSALSGSQLDTLMNANPLADSTAGITSSTLHVSDALDVLKTFGLVGVGIVAGLVGLSFVFANVIIPQAAEQLEAQAKKDYPDLWQEYTSQLGPGEKLIDRPDIMQSLGKQVQERMMKEFDEQQQAPNPSSSQGSGKDASSVVDAEIVKDDD